MVPCPWIRTIALGLCFTGLGACGGKHQEQQQSASASPSGTIANPLQITGHERIGWTQTAGVVDTIHFGFYLDVTARAELRASCRPSKPGTFECDAPLPPLSDGPHMLEMVAWLVAGGRDVEGPRAEAIHVVVGTGSTNAQQTLARAPSAVPSPSPSPSSSAPAATGCGLAAPSEREVLMWTDRGEIQVIDRQSRATRQISWNSPDTQSWRLSSIAVDPQFTENRTVFMTEIQSNGEGPKIRLSRYRDVADVLGERAVLLEAPLSTPPSRTALTVGADKLLHIALLVSPDSEPSHAEHLFVIRVDENGRVPPDNPGASMFDRPTASAPVAVAWNGNARQPWVVEEIRRGRYLVKPAMLEARERHNFDSAGPPAAIQLVDKDGKQRLFSVDRNGEILTMDLVDGEWAIRGRTPLVTGLQSVQDFLMFGDGEVFVCGSTGAGAYGIWRGRPPL